MTTFSNRSLTNYILKIISYLFDNLLSSDRTDYPLHLHGLGTVPFAGSRITAGPEPRFLLYAEGSSLRLTA